MATKNAWNRFTEDVLVRSIGRKLDEKELVRARNFGRNLGSLLPIHGEVPEDEVRESIHIAQNPCFPARPLPPPARCGAADAEPGHEDGAKHSMALRSTLDTAIDIVVACSLFAVRIRMFENEDFWNCSF